MMTGAAGQWDITRGAWPNLLRHGTVSWHRHAAVFGGYPSQPAWEPRHSNQRPAGPVPAHPRRREVSCSAGGPQLIHDARSGGPGEFSMRPTWPDGLQWLPPTTHHPTRRWFPPCGGGGGVGADDGRVGGDLISRPCGWTPVGCGRLPERLRREGFGVRRGGGLEGR